MDRKKILLLTLETFRAAGGIQRMNRILAYTLQEIGTKHQYGLKVYTLCDQQHDLDAKYLSGEQFKAFKNNKIKFAWQCIRTGMQADLIILSHIHLSLIGWMIRLLNPGCQIWVIAHGIEVWRPLKGWKKVIWNTCDKVICVSRYTQQKIIERHKVNPDKCIVMNNILDPFITLPKSFKKPEYLQERYKINGSQKVILTLTRISASECHKGYDLLLKAISMLKKGQQNIRYVLAGPYDQPEQARLLKLAAKYGLQDNFILTGFLNDKELSDHFLLADLFVLPSKKEGFGIVFIEAMAFGLPVICGNADGSVDAVRNPEMGIAIDPDDVEALQKNIVQQLDRVLTVEERLSIQANCLKYFNQTQYMERLESLINDEQTA